MRRKILILCCLLLTSCTSNIYDEHINLYNSLVDETNSYNKSDINEYLPFDIEVYFEKVIDSEITYRVILDNPKISINNIKAIVIHNYETKDIYPTSGIFEESLNLIPNVVDLKSNNVKGVILVGYIDYAKDIESFKGTVKVLVEYNDLDGNLNKVYSEYHK